MATTEQEIVCATSQAGGQDAATAEERMRAEAASADDDVAEELDVTMEGGKGRRSGRDRGGRGTGLDQRLPERNYDHRDARATYKRRRAWLLRRAPAAAVGHDRRADAHASATCSGISSRSRPIPYSALPPCQPSKMHHAATSSPCCRRMLFINPGDEHLQPAISATTISSHRDFRVTNSSQVDTPRA